MVGCLDVTAYLFRYFEEASLSSFVPQVVACSLNTNGSNRGLTVTIRTGAVDSENIQELALWRGNYVRIPQMSKSQGRMHADDERQGSRQKQRGSVADAWVPVPLPLGRDPICLLAPSQSPPKLVQIVMKSLMTV